MHIVSFVSKEAPGAPPRCGALLPDEVHLVDFAAAIGSQPSSYLSWFDLSGEHLPQAIAWMHQHAAQVLEGGAGLPAHTLVPLADVQLLAPVPRPSKVICIGLNYRDHAAESRMDVPTSPITFSKYPTSITYPAGPVLLPRTSTQVDYEAELAVVIGRRAKHVPKDQAFDYVLGYANFNDVSARDFQFSDKQWQRGKSCDTFAPMGPAIVTKEEIGDPHDLRIQLRLNGQTMQDSSTNQLVFGVDDLVSFISETVTLEPGDVIATGTPPGVGFARKPPVYLKPGDLMEVEVQGLGVLSNPVLADPA
jgi:2-keto-4-pentenoate hydratase/2-oxohepta-3-ene-1,7-dioic acid hydratase in catechol pathway